MNFSGRGSSLWTLPISPSMALALGFPSIGYYTFATYASLSGAGMEGSVAAIATRASALLVLGAAFFSAWRYRTPLPARLIPGLLFVGIYLLRMLENIGLQGVSIAYGNGKAFLIFIFSSILTSLALSIIWRGLSSRDCRIIFSFMAVFFTAGALFSMDNSGMLRLAFTKVNPISLAYVCSSFIFYYLLIAQKSWRAGIEAVIMIPFLIMIAAQAQSRGMMISSAVCLMIYIATRRGKHLFVTLGMMGLLLVMVMLTIDYHYFETALAALQRIDPVNDRSTAIRVLLFRGAFEQFLADPLFGRYVNELNTGFYPHNIYLESLMAVGFIGSIPFFLHLFFASTAAFSILWSNNTNWLWAFIALMFFREAIGAAASFSIWGIPGFWITSFLVIAIWHGRRRSYAWWRIQTGAVAMRAGIHQPPGRTHPVLN